MKLQDTVYAAKVTRNSEQDTYHAAKAIVDSRTTTTTTTTKDLT